jgi:hypothetical protein
MKYRIVLLIITTISSIHLFSDPLNKSTLEYNELNGKIKTWIKKEVTIKRENGEIIREVKPYDYYKLNEQGYSIYHINIDYQNTWRRFTAKYKDNGESITKTYDKKGKLLITSYSTYDPETNTIKSISKDRTGKVLESWKKVYDPKQRQLIITKYQGNFEKKEITTITTYTEDEKMLFDEIIDHQYGYSSKSKFVYDSRGNRIESISESDSGWIDHFYIEYEDGNAIGGKDYIDSQLDCTWEATFSRSGRKQSHHVYNADGSVRLKNIYAYDVHGNEILWKQYWYKNGKYELGRYRAIHVLVLPVPVAITIRNLR